MRNVCIHRRLDDRPRLPPIARISSQSFSSSTRSALRGCSGRNGYLARSGVGRASVHLASGLATSDRAHPDTVSAEHRSC